MIDIKYEDPTPDDLKSREFEAVWQAIKKWDLSRENNGLYSGATGTDVMIILKAIRPVIARCVNEALEKACKDAYERGRKDQNPPTERTVRSEEI